MSKEQVAVALIGTGRIGQEHARSLAYIPWVRVEVVCDARAEAARATQPLARAASVSDSVEAVLARKDIQAVVVCTPTDTHADLIEASARAGKAVFCEKPVALDLDRTTKALKIVAKSNVPFQIGFQRRFDSGYAEAKRRIEAGAIGRLDQFRAVGRDPGPPPKEYLAKSGGLFIDQAIHDFDLARFLMGEVDEVQAWGTVRFSSDAAELGDVDTATTLLRFKSGALGVVENSRRAIFGYDIVTEVFGEKGKLIVHAEPKTPLRHYRDSGCEIDHFHFFMDRFGPAFRAELEYFFTCFAEHKSPSPGPADALESLKIGVAATKSWKERRPVKLTEVAN
jgi:myo-inositol 2-dehydrogenase / D-chiro-inositol 1-dehydrogenase